MTSPETPYFLWVDLETTGLDTEKCQVLEAAWILTTPDLRVLGVRHHVMRDYVGGSAPLAVRTMHSRSGLMKAREKGDVFVDGVPASVLDLIGHGPARRERIALAGAGIGPFDVPIIRRLWPEIAKRVEYYPWDVSPARRAAEWFGDPYPDTQVGTKHRALPDAAAALRLGRLIRDREGQPRLVPYDESEDSW